MKMKPLYDMIIVQRFKADQSTQGGIVLPSMARIDPFKGIVVRVGTGRRCDNGKVLPMDIKIGDKVFFGGKIASAFEEDGEQYLMMTDSNVYALVED